MLCCQKTVYCLYSSSTYRLCHTEQRLLKTEDTVFQCFPNSDLRQSVVFRLLNGVRLFSVNDLGPADGSSSYRQPQLTTRAIGTENATKQQA